MDAPCDFLPWDTDFFGVRIARVKAHHLTPDLVRAIDQWCIAESIDCLYFLADVNDSTTTRLVEDNHYRFVDLRLTFEHNLRFLPSENNPAIREYRAEDLPQLEAIASTSYTDSRYYFDPCFPREKCDELYATWIRSSTQGFADKVFVAELDGLTAGYISCKCHETIGNIGLVGVAQQARGFSLGQSLVKHALGWFADQGMTQVQVVTQGRNIPAQRLYQRCGFLTMNLQSWYHKWYNGVCT